MANIKRINALYKAAMDKGYHIILGYSDGSPEADEAASAISHHAWWTE